MRPGPKSINPVEAQQLRAQGLSWKQVADQLSGGRKTPFKDQSVRSAVVRYERWLSTI